ncbi:MAG: SiaB family protein kinase [Rhodocyclaceae bacterium]
MNIEIFKGYRQFVTEQGVLFYYDGFLSQPIIAAMSEALRCKLEAEDNSSQARRKVFSAFVEMMQNIIHYTDVDPSIDTSAPIFGNVAVGRKNNHYYIVSGNTVATHHVARLEAKLQAIHAMSLDEIKAEYKRKLRTGEEAQDANSKGAGLGFLTVARDASEPIEFLFEPIPGSGNALSFFYLKATV